MANKVKLLINMNYGNRQFRPKRVMYGMTLIEMLCFIALVILAIVGIKLGHKLFENLYGGLLGGILGIIIFVVCIFAFGFVIHLWSGTGLPKCRNGCCQGPDLSSKNDGDYKIQEVDGKFYEICKCGDRYLRRGRRFLLINKDGTETPYLIWRRFKGWAPDK